MLGQADALESTLRAICLKYRLNFDSLAEKASSSNSHDRVLATLKHELPGNAPLSLPTITWGRGGTVNDDDDDDDDEVDDDAQIDPTLVLAFIEDLAFLCLPASLCSDEVAGLLEATLPEMTLSQVLRILQVARLVRT
jgi:hypothetical protein